MLASAQLARSPGFRLNGVMRGEAILVPGAYSVGRQSAPVSNAPVPAIITSLLAIVMRGADKEDRAAAQ